MKKRGIVIHPQELTEDWLERASAMHINVLGLHPAGGKNAAETLQKMLDSLPEKQPLLEKAARLGITIEFEMHTLGYLMPRTLFAAHPDWFRMQENGERTPDGNFCVSNAEALAYLEESCADLAKKLPQTSHNYYFWMDDARGYRCNCPACRNYTPSDQQLLAVNAMLRGVRRVDAQAKMAYIAYLDALEIPEHVRPSDGVFLEFAPFDRRVDKFIADPDCPENRKESRFLPELLGFFGKKDAKVLDYWTDNSKFSNWTYPPKPFVFDPAVMAQDVAYYRHLGFDSVTAFGCFLGPEYIELYGTPDLSAYGRILEKN